MIFIFSITQPLTKLGSPNLGFWENTSHRTVHMFWVFKLYLQTCTCTAAGREQMTSSWTAAVREQLTFSWTAAGREQLTSSWTATVREQLTFSWTAAGRKQLSSSSTEAVREEGFHPTGQQLLENSCYIAGMQL